MENEVTRNDYQNFKVGADYKKSPHKAAALGGKDRLISGFKSRDLLDLKDIFIAVKTTRKYHKSRMELLVQTWVSQAKEQVRRW